MPNYSSASGDWGKCAAFLDKGHPLSASDISILKKSQSEPIASGGAWAPFEYRKRKPSRPGRENVQDVRWSAYFIGQEDQLCFDSISATLEGLKPRLDKLSERRAQLGDIHQPLKLFFVCGDVAYSLSDQLGGFLPREQTFKSGSNSWIGILRQLRFKIGDRIQDYDFKEASSVVLLSSGNELVGSSWNDNFTLSHEIAHGTAFMAFVPKFFSEGRADFKAAITSGMTTFNHHFDGPSRDIKNPELLHIDEFFTRVSHHATYYQVGSLFAHFLYSLWTMSTESHLNINMDSLLYRTGTLLSTESPYVKRNGIVNEYKNPEVFRQTDVAEIMNFVAAVTMQWSAENKLPVGVTEWICRKWSELGVRGPFRRYREHDINPKGVKSLAYSEEKFNGIFFPGSWYTCDELVVSLKSGASRLPE